MTAAPEESFIEVDGLRLAVRSWGATDGRPMLGLHGWLDNAATMDGLAPALVETGCRLVSLDLPGHGRSEHRAADASYHFVDAVACAAHVLDALGWERCTLMGHSMGAGIASLLAGTEPDRFDAVVLFEGLGPLAQTPETSPQRLADAIADERRRLARARRSRPAKRVFERREDAVERLVDVQGVTVASAKTLCARGLAEVSGGFAWTADPRLRRPSRLRFTEDHVLAFLRRITAPTLYVAASQGFSFDDALMMARQHAVSDLKIVEVEGGHHVHLDHPERIVPALRAFLDATAPGGTA